MSDESLRVVLADLGRKVQELERMEAEATFGEPRAAYSLPGLKRIKDALASALARLEAVERERDEAIDTALGLCNILENPLAQTHGFRGGDEVAAEVRGTLAALA